MKNILITGVAGFIGSNLADKLIKEGQYNIIGIDNLAYGVKEQIPQEVKFFQLDIRSKKIFPLFKNVDYVFHLAAKNCINDCQNDPVETSDINVTGTQNVFEAAKQANVKKVIYAESSALYEGSSLIPTPEATESPESFYAISKLASSLFSKAYLKYFGLPFTALRYFCVYGPRQDYRRTIPPVFSAFIIKLLQKKQPIIYGTGEKRRDFVHVDDINDFHIQCLADERTINQTFNLGSGKNYSINEIYNIVADIIGSNIKPIYKPDMPGEAFQTLADITKIKRLGWKPKINLKSGLLSMIEYIMVRYTAQRRHSEQTGETRSK